MLHDQGMQLHIWAKACNITVYMQKKIPHRILGMITPKEDFPGRKPDVSHFQIFEATAYCHVSNDNMKKLEPTTEMRYFIGYI